MKVRIFLSVTRLDSAHPQDGFLTRGGDDTWTLTEATAMIAGWHPRFRRLARLEVVA